MADTSNTTGSGDTPVSQSAPESSFLNETPSSVKSEDTLYNDFFQENGSGEMTLGTKKERSGLEVLVNVLEYTAILAVIIGAVSALHVFVRSLDDVSFLENYPFACPYLNYDVTLPSTEKGCKNIAAIKKEYEDKKQVLEENILDALTEYIPIKVSSSILDASPEKKFIINTFQTKPRVNNVLEAFERVKSNAQKTIDPTTGEKNIKCTGITVTDGDTLSTQCTIEGGEIGSSNTNGQIGSSRIEALDFMEKLADTTKSSLILNNYQTSLSIGSVFDKETNTYVTTTLIPISVRYVPLIEKP
ncbi:hypothetical protein K2X92_02150 [Candidatus Gracilibacteria bacterium]|nr:hypothetical protein [Candidatus Gracilibacteria bacterium]